MSSLLDAFLNYKLLHIKRLWLEFLSCNVKFYDVFLYQGLNVLMTNNQQWPTF
jgi:hypothetical protein